jgi:hypothetical protein
LQKLTIGLCLMVWNELPGCQLDIPRIPFGEFDEVFALDGGSTDGTIEYLEQRGITVVRQAERGYNRAYIAAFRHTACDALVIFHPKGTIDPQSLSKFIPALRTGTDLVVASRNIRGASNEEDGRLFKPRKWLVTALAVLSGLLWWRGGGPVIWDVLHGYRGMRKDAFFAIDPLPDGLSMDLQMIVRAYRLGLSRFEIPVQEIPRPEGTTHFKALPTGLNLLRYIKLELGRAIPACAVNAKQSDLPKRPSA